MKVLVAYDSKHGSTHQIAEWIAHELRTAGLSVVVCRAAGVVSVAGYDAVVLGSALYLGRWRPGARTFVRRHARALAGVPVWLFSSGPLDDSADRGTVAPVRHAADAVRRLHARDHVTFGGALSSSVSGLFDSALARRVYGDFRNREQIHAWAEAIASELAVPYRAAS